MEIKVKQPTAKGPAEWFTGDVWIDGIVRGEEPSRVRVSAVRFTPSARTAWHSHAVGQTLYVTDGRGLVQSRNGDVVEMHPGDIIYTPADEWHWRGAAPDHFMTHLTITEAVPGDLRPEADWGDHITDDEYCSRLSRLQTRSRSATTRCRSPHRDREGLDVVVVVMRSPDQTGGSRCRRSLCEREPLRSARLALGCRRRAWSYAPGRSA